MNIGPPAWRLADCAAIKSMSIMRSIILDLRGMFKEKRRLDAYPEKGWVSIAFFLYAHFELGI